MQTQIISRARVSLSPHQMRYNNTTTTDKKARLNLSSFETAHRVYDNKTYTHQIHKMFDSMNKSSSRKPSPSKNRIISSSFINPMANNSSRDIPTPLPDSVLTEGHLGSETGLQDISSGSIMPVVSRGALGREKHKRTVSMLAPNDNTSKDFMNNARNTQKTPLVLLGANPIELMQDNLTHKPRRESPSIKAQLLQYSTYTTKNTKPTITLNRKIVIPFPSRSQVAKRENSAGAQMKSGWEGSKDEKKNQMSYKGYEKGQSRGGMKSSKQMGNGGSDEDDAGCNESFLPNMEDVLIINHEIQGSQTSLIMNTSGDFDEKNGISGNVTRRESVKGKRGSVKMTDLVNLEKIYSNSMRRTVAPKNKGKDNSKENNTQSMRNKEQSGSPKKKEAEDGDSWRGMEETRYKRVNTRQEEDVREKSRDNSIRRNKHRRSYEKESGTLGPVDEATVETTNGCHLSIKTNESDIEGKYRRGGGESPVKAFRRAYTNNQNATSPVGKKKIGNEEDKRKGGEFGKVEHKRATSTEASTSHHGNWNKA